MPNKGYWFLSEVSLYSKEHSFNVDQDYRIINRKTYLPAGLTLTDIKIIRCTIKCEIVTITTASQLFQIVMFNLIPSNNIEFLKAPTNKFVQEIGADGIVLNEYNSEAILKTSTNIVSIRLNPTVLGKEYTIVHGETGTCRIYPDAAEEIRGAVAINKHYYSNTVGNTVTLICVEDGIWDIKAQFGTWTHQT